VKRNIAALMALMALMLGQGAPLMALDRHCPMQPAGTSLCGVCDFGGASGQGAQVNAGSCCTFETANPAPQTPGVVPTIQKPGAAPTLDAIVSIHAHLERLPYSQRSRSARSSTRSTPSPLTLGTTLRL